MFFIAAVFAVFYLIMAAAVDVWMIFVGRFGTGLATGACAIAANVYVAETASAKYRGLLGSCFQVRYKAVKLGYDYDHIPARDYKHITYCN